MAGLTVDAPHLLRPLALAVLIANRQDSLAYRNNNFE